MSLMSPALAGGFFTISATWEVPDTHHRISTAYCYELRYWCWEWLKAGGEGDNRGWDGWMVSLTWWPWIWVISESCWWTGKPWATVNGITKSWIRLNDWADWKWSEVTVIQSCPTLCNPMGDSPPVFSVHGILQARILGCVAIPFFRGSSWPRDQTWVSRIAGRFFTIRAKTVSLIWLLNFFSF